MIVVDARLEALARGAVPLSDPVFSRIDVCPVCADVGSVLLLADHLARTHGWDKAAIVGFVRDVERPRAVRP